METEARGSRVDPIPPNLLRVAADTDAIELAEAICIHVIERDKAILRGVGFDANNQAAKSVAIARAKLAKANYDLVCRISFVNVVGREGQNISALEFTCEPLSV